MGKQISLAPSKQIKGGTAFDDVDVEIVGAAFEAFGYPDKVGNDTIQNPIPALSVTFRNSDGGPEDGSKDWTQHYSAGDYRRVRATEDGEGLEPVDEDKEYEGLTDNCRAGIFLKHLVAAGFPEQLLLQDPPRISAIVGTKGHVRQIDPPKLGKGDDKKILVVTKVTEAPGKGSAKSGAKASGSKVEETARTFVQKVVEKVGGPVPKIKIGQAANKHFEGKPEKTAVVTLILDDKFLKKAGQPWSYNGREVGPAEEAAEPEIDLS